MQGWEHIQSIPVSRTWMLLAAVFLLFSSIGFYTSLINGDHLTRAGAIVSAVLAGIVAEMWIYVLARRAMVWMVAPFVFSLIVGPMGTVLNHWIAHSLHSGPLAARAGVGFCATSSLAVVMASYGFFITFITHEGSESVKLRTELELAQSIQKTLVPPFMLRIESFEMYGISMPSEKVGGDLVDALILPHGNAAAFLGDISGHGLQAGILMGMLKTATRTALLDSDGREPCNTLPALLHRLNTVLPNVKEPHMYATFTAFRLGADGSVFYALAASPPILHWHADRQAMSKIEEEQFPLGLFPVPGFSGNAMTMGCGDMLIVATDGILEACDRSGEEFGLERMEWAIGTRVTAPLPDVAAAVLDTVRAFGKQADDQTILLIRRL